MSTTPRTAMSDADHVQSLCDNLITCLALTFAEWSAGMYYGLAMANAQSIQDKALRARAYALIYATPRAFRQAQSIERAIVEQERAQQLDEQDRVRELREREDIDF